MSRVYCMVTIAERSQGKLFSELFREEKVPVGLVMLGRGTTSSEMLDTFGLDGSEKIVSLSIVTGETWSRVKRKMERKLKIDIPGRGISFLIPVGSMGGAGALRFFLAEQEYKREEEASLKQTEQELLVVISNYGYTTLVMDAAKAAGAAGGTILHAKGTGMEQAERFLGVTLAAEKEMTFIVARSEKKKDIMKAIMEQAGLESKAKSIVFSLPVTETAGLRLSGD